MNTDEHRFDFDNLNVELLNQAAVIRFSRPEIKNPLSIKTLEELKKVFAFLELTAIKNHCFYRFRQHFCFGREFE